VFDVTGEGAGHSMDIGCGAPYHHVIMSGTTVDIDAPILRDLERLQKREGKSPGRLISDLLADALARQRASRSQPVPFRWASRSMRARVDLSDKDALYAALEAKGDTRSR
jgi:hypothetical protein